jgi:hypothetical protein
MRRALLTLAGVASASAAALPGSLVGIFLPGDNVLPNLAVVSIDPNSAANKTLSTASLGPIKTTFPAKSTKSADGLLVVTAATADGIYTFDTTTGESKQLAPLPAYNDSDPLIGLVTLPDGIYMLTQSALWAVADGAVTSVATFDALPPVAQVAVAPSAGTGGKPLIYVGDTESTALYAIDTGDSYSLSAVKVRGGEGVRGWKSGTIQLRGCAQAQPLQTQPHNACQRPPLLPLPCALCRRPSPRCGTCSTARTWRA